MEIPNRWEVRMKVTAQTKALLEAVQAASRIVPQRPGRAVAGMKLEVTDDGRLRLKATDLATVYLTNLDLIERQSEGTAVVGSKVLGDVLRVLGGDTVRLETGSAGELHITSGKSRFVIRTVPPEDFPEVEVPEIQSDPGTLEIPREEFDKSVGQVIGAAATEETRPVFTGCLFEVVGNELRLACTDSYRLAEKVIYLSDAKEDKRAVVPSRVLEELRKTAIQDGEETSDVVRIMLGNDSAVFGVGRTQTKVRYVEGMFPDYRNLIPTNYPFQLRVPKEVMLEAVKRVSVLARDVTPIRFNLTEGRAVVEVKDPEIGEGAEEVDGSEYDGDEMHIAFNPRYVIDAVAGCDTEVCVVAVKDPLSAALFMGEGDESYRHLVMPVRL
jgi:DNA polymerase-3 subunit beta